MKSSLPPLETSPLKVIIWAAFANGLFFYITFPVIGCPMNFQTLALYQTKMVSHATLLYASDWDDHFPSSRSQSQYRHAVSPYLAQEDHDPFTLPEYKVNLKFNLRLSEINQSTIPNPDKVIILSTPFYEKNAWEPSLYVVARANGAAQKIKEENWQTERKNLLTKVPE